MKNKIFIIVVLLIFYGSANSQINEYDNLLGASFGVFISSGSPSFGGNYEYQITQLGDVASLGIGAVLRYTAYKDRFPFDDYNDYNYTTIGFQTNFNFKNIGSGKFVPFVGVVLGYNSINNTYINRSGRVYTANYSSGTWFWGQGGFRYFFSPKVAGGIRLGSGNFNFNVLEFSVDFKF
jgi:hypothetical protein